MSPHTVFDVDSPAEDVRDARLNHWISSQHRLALPDSDEGHVACRESALLPDNFDDDFVFPVARYQPSDIAEETACASNSRFETAFTCSRDQIVPTHSEYSGPDLEDEGRDEAIEVLMHEMNSWRLPSGPRHEHSRSLSDREKPLPSVPGEEPVQLRDWTQYIPSQPSSPLSTGYSSPPSSPSSPIGNSFAPEAFPRVRSKPSIQHLALSTDALESHPAEYSPRALTNSASYASLRSRTKSTRFPSISITLSSVNSSLDTPAPGSLYGGSSPALRHAVYIPSEPPSPTTPTPTPLGSNTPALTHKSSFSSAFPPTPSPGMYPSSLLHSSLPVVEDDDSVRHFDHGTPDGLLNVYAGGGAAASRWSVATSANPSGSPSHPAPLPSTPSKSVLKVKSKPSLTLVDNGSPKDRSSKSFRKRILSGLKSLRSPTLSAGPSSSFTQTTFPPSPPLTPLSDPFQSDGMALTPSQQYYFSPPPTAPQSPTDFDSRCISQSTPSAQSGLFDMQEEPQHHETVHAHRVQLPYTPSMKSMPLNSSLGVDREESTISASGFTSASQYGYLNFPPPTSPSRSASLSKRSFVYETDVDSGAGTGTDGGKPSLDWKNISRSRLSFGSVASGKSTMGTTRRLGGGKPKKLLVSGLPVADARAEEAIRTWCESFGEVRKISHKPNGVLQVSWKKSSVADTVCRLQAQVYIEGAGSVALSWASSSKRV